MGSRRYPVRDIKILFSLSAGRCAFPGCRALCIVPATEADREVVTAQIAHIAAHSDQGPRAVPTLAQAERDSYGNWILLCPEHHEVVDNQTNTYTIEELRIWKREHELWVLEMYSQSMPSVTFAELQVVAAATLNNPQLPSDSFTLTPPREKMAKNGLTDQSSFMLMLSIGKAKDVETFVESMAQLDYTFPERLRSGFLNKYNELSAEGLEGDSLFQAMLEFSAGISTDFRIRSAGLAVLGYMFEKCEVFEP